MQRHSPISSPGEKQKPKGRVAQLVEHSTLNRLVVGSIPTASTTFLPIYQALTSTSRLLPTMRFPNLDQNLDQTFSLIALIDRNPQWFQFLVLIRLHRLQVGVPHGLAYRKGIAALFHRVGAVGVPC